MSKLIKFFSLSAAVIGLVYIFSMPVSSQINSVGLSIVPAISEKVVSAGQLSIVPITVTNVSGSAQGIAIEFRPLAPIDPVIDQSARNRYDASSWLSADTMEFLLAQGESQTVQIRVNPPNDAGAGGHYSNVVFKVLNSPDSENQVSSTYISPELSSVLFMTVPGDISELIQTNFSFPSLLSQTRIRSFSLDVSNIGTVHVLPRADIAIKDMRGNEVDLLALPPKIAIPGTMTTVDAVWEDASPGIYKAELSLSYGSPIKQVSHTSGWFVVLPAIWIQAVMIASLALAVRLLLPPIFRRLQKKRIKLARDLTGEPNIHIAREKIERADQLSNLNDGSRKK